MSFSSSICAVTTTVPPFTAAPMIVTYNFSLDVVVGGDTVLGGAFNGTLSVSGTLVAGVRGLALYFDGTRQVCQRKLFLISDGPRIFQTMGWEERGQQYYRPGRQPIILGIFPRKLHENQNKLGLMGARPWHPLDPLMLMILFLWKCKV